MQAQTPIPEDFACPDPLSELGKIACRAIVKFLQKRNDLKSGGCKAFYSPEEWKARGEEYGVDSILVVVHDGGALAGCFNYDYECYDDIDKMNKALLKVGCYAEPCTTWYTAIYPA